MEANEITIRVARRVENSTESMDGRDGSFRP